MTKDEALKKISRLLKLSESPNPNEAALAAQKAQELMVKYEIEKEALSDVSTDKDEPIENVINQPLDRMKQRFIGWKTSLAECIARANHCRTYLSYQHLAIGLIGRRSDMDTVRYLYMMLANNVNELCDQEKARNTARRMKVGKTFYNNYKLGIVDAINEKLNKAKELAIEKAYTEANQEQNSLALVRIDNALAKMKQRDKDVDIWMRTKMNLRFHSSPHRHSENARKMGYNAGQKITINKARGSLT